MPFLHSMFYILHPFNCKQTINNLELLNPLGRRESTTGDTHYLTYMFYPSNVLLMEVS
jgi:hypothetical protein